MRGKAERVYFFLAGTASLLAFLLIVLGSVVRATGSGLGCPDWPTCYGRLFPPLEFHALLEYSHRSVAALLIFATTAAALTGLLLRRRLPVSPWPAWAALGAMVGEAALGAVVVATELDPLLVSVHLALSLLILALLLKAALDGRALSLEHRAGKASPGAARLALTLPAALFLLLVSGAYVRAAGATLAFLDWPLMGGRLLPDLSRAGAGAQFLHRLLALLVFLYLLGATARLRRLGAPRPALLLSAAGLATYLLQALAGGAVILLRMPPAAVVAHVALATTTWTLVVAAALLAGPLSTPGDLAFARAPEPEAGEA